MADNKFGVINEQGYPAGQFGFSPINESDKKILMILKKNLKMKKKRSNSQ